MTNLKNCEVCGNEFDQDRRPGNAKSCDNPECILRIVRNNNARHQMKRREKFTYIRIEVTKDFRKVVDNFSLEHEITITDLVKRAIIEYMNKEVI